MIGLPLFTVPKKWGEEGGSKRGLHRVEEKRNAPEEKRVNFKIVFVATQTNPALRRIGPVQVLKGNTRFSQK